MAPRHPRRYNTYGPGFAAAVLGTCAAIASPPEGEPGGIRGRAGRAEFVALGDLPGGLFESRALGISRDGRVIVGSSSSGRSYASPPFPGAGASVHALEAFIWTDQDGMVGLGDLPGDPYFHSIATAASADGSVIVGSSCSPASTASPLIGAEGFIWTRAAGLHGLGVIPNIQQTSPAMAVSDDGSVVVGYIAFGQGSYEAYRWTWATGLVGLGNLDGFVKFGTAVAISADGSLAVGSDNASGGPMGNHLVPAISTGEHPWSVLVDAPGYAAGISADGTVVVGEHATAGGSRPFRWSASSGLVDLPALEAARNLGVAAASADASVIVGTAASLNGGTPIPWVWTERTGTIPLARLLKDGHGLALAGWTLQSANAVSGDGRAIVGSGFNPHGKLEAFLVRLPGASCAADISGDGTVDGNDFDAFINAFDAGAFLADVFPDGFIDGVDYDTFMLSFETGC